METELPSTVGNAAGQQDQYPILAEARQEEPGRSASPPWLPKIITALSPKSQGSQGEPVHQQAGQPVHQQAHAAGILAMSSSGQPAHLQAPVARLPVDWLSDPGRNFPHAPPKLGNHGDPWQGSDTTGTRKEYGTNGA